MIASNTAREFVTRLLARYGLKVLNRCVELKITQGKTSINVETAINEPFIVKITLVIRGREEVFILVPAKEGWFLGGKSGSNFISTATGKIVVNKTPVNMHAAATNQMNRIFRNLGTLKLSKWKVVKKQPGERHNWPQTVLSDYLR